MRLSWGQTVAGGLTVAVVAGLLLLPSRLLGPDRPVDLAIPAPRGTAWSVQAAPPRAIPHRHAARPKIPAASTTAVSTTARQTYVPRAQTARPDIRTVKETRPRVVVPHRSAVISKLVPTAPLVRARLLAAASPQRSSLDTTSSTAKTIAALAASLRKK